MKQDLITPPKIDLTTHHYLETFYRIADSRNVHMGGVTAIPVSEIISYAESVGHLEDTTEHFIDIIKSMDSVYMNHLQGR